MDGGGSDKGKIKNYRLLVARQQHKFILVHVIDFEFILPTAKPFSDAGDPALMLALFQYHNFGNSAATAEDYARNV